MTLLYCDCFSGISGDMFLGALLDAGLPLEHLEARFRQLGLPEFAGVSARRVQKGALAATLLELHLHEHGHDHTHSHDHEHEHDHDHDHDRSYADIRALIETSALPARVKELSLAVFQKLAEAEARVHGTTPEQVHFHEVGAADSILDIVGAAAGLEYFGVEKVYSSPLPLGSGTVDTRHGRLPVPAPATLELLTAAGAPVIPSPARCELVTPTGAALLAALAGFTQPAMRLVRTGTGAGRRDLEWPNVMRVLLGEADAAAGSHVEIETNIDDMNPQVYGAVMARLFQAGALDVYLTPITMKKLRPAVRLSVIARREDEERLCALLLAETSTLGVRVTPLRRHEACREMRTIDTPYGPVRVKLKLLEGRPVQAAPEYDDCARIAEEHRLPVLQVLREVEALAAALIR